MLGTTSALLREAAGQGAVVQRGAACGIAADNLLTGRTPSILHGRGSGQTAVATRGCALGRGMPLSRLARAAPVHVARAEPHGRCRACRQSAAGRRRQPVRSNGWAAAVGVGAHESRCLRGPDQPVGPLPSRASTMSTAEDTQLRRSPPALPQPVDTAYNRTCVRQRRGSYLCPRCVSKPLSSP
jgi:hypothetical protein